ncbi:MAG: hypothetical protein LBP26_05305, partial [Clostridiales bacterium]|nr:hypothetical protein [Clostridiales bacterium]
KTVDGTILAEKNYVFSVLRAGNTLQTLADNCALYSYAASDTADGDSLCYYLLITAPDAAPTATEPVTITEPTPLVFDSLGGYTIKAVAVDRAGRTYASIEAEFDVSLFATGEVRPNLDDYIDGATTFTGTQISLSGEGTRFHADIAGVADGVNSATMAFKNQVDVSGDNSCAVEFTMPEYDNATKSHYITYMYFRFYSVEAPGTYLEFNALWGGVNTTTGWRMKLYQNDIQVGNEITNGTKGSSNEQIFISHIKRGNRDGNEFLSNGTKREFKLEFNLTDIIKTYIHSATNLPVYAAEDTAQYGSVLVSTGTTGPAFKSAVQSAFSGTQNVTMTLYCERFGNGWNKTDGSKADFVFQKVGDSLKKTSAPTLTVNGKILKNGIAGSAIVLPTAIYNDGTVNTSVSPSVEQGIESVTVAENSFTPDANGIYTVIWQSGELTLTYDIKIKSMPSYTAPTGLTATYGNTLADVELPDGFAWADPSVSVGNASQTPKEFGAVFTPSDTDNYLIVGVDVSVTVGKAMPSYTVPTGLTATYGDTLADVELPDGFAWADPSVSVGNASQTPKEFGAVFTLADSGNYLTDVIIPVTISKAAPTVRPRYTAPDALYAGGELPLLLLTDGDTAGTLQWSEYAVTEGEKEYKWEFLPADGVNYAVVSGTIRFTAVTRPSVSDGGKSGCGSAVWEVSPGGGIFAAAVALILSGVCAFIRRRKNRRGGYKGDKTR